MKAKKRFGQNFLVKEEYINSIIDAVNVFSNDLIIEIGPGKGALTRLLKEKKAQLIAFEIDTDLKPILSHLEDNLTQIIYQDFLTIQKEDIKIPYNNLYIVGNLPYYITTPILEHIIKSDFNPEEIIIMVQKEVAERFLAKPHSKEYGYFTLYLKYYFDISKVVDVPRTAFNPIPNVDSTVLKLRKRTDKPAIDPTKYQEFLKECFKEKRKQLKNNLKAYNWDQIKQILSEFNVSETARAEELSEEILIKIFQAINQ